jgi:hypothetical protein
VTLQSSGIRQIGVGKPPIIIGVDENDRQAAAEKMEQQRRCQAVADSPHTRNAAALAFSCACLDRLRA